MVEVLCATFLEETVSHLFGWFSKMLFSLRYLYFIFLVRGLLLMSP
jgi:hypothetical protein